MNLSGKYRIKTINAFILLLCCLAAFSMLTGCIQNTPSTSSVQNVSNTEPQGKTSAFNQGGYQGSQLEKIYGNTSSSASSEPQNTGTVANSADSNTIANSATTLEPDNRNEQAAEVVRNEVINCLFNSEGGPNFEKILISQDIPLQYQNNDNVIYVLGRGVPLEQYFGYCKYKDASITSFNILKQDSTGTVADVFVHAFCYEQQAQQVGVNLPDKWIDVKLRVGYDNEGKFFLISFV